MPTLDGEVNMASYANRLKALHADVNLFNHVKFFIRDLFEFNDDEGAQLRILEDRTVNFYMNSVYFTPKQVDILLSFEGRDGRTLEEALRSTIDPNDSTSGYEICTVHDFALVLQDLFDVKKDFYVEHGFKFLFNKFAKKRLD